MLRDYSDTKLEFFSPESESTVHRASNWKLNVHAHVAFSSLHIWWRINIKWNVFEFLIQIKVFTVFVPVMTWTVNLVDWNLEVDIWHLWGRQLKILSLQIWQCWCDKYQNSFVQHFEKIARHTCVEDLTKNGIGQVRFDR